ncbi:MAG: sigma-70 family RNA polymerase sigma factor [Elusimicrobia bacterium]|nr:sigma-70 family RNA polymerase sigma factor [Candidatus Liberimonas magnetica]
MTKHLDYFAYAGEIRSKPLLTELEIKQLLLKEERNKALEIIISRTLRLVCKHVQRYSSFSKRLGLEQFDLFQAGATGLILALAKYSCNKGYFYNYVTKYIKAYIINEVFSNFGYSRNICLKKMKLGQNINPTDSLESIVSDNSEDNSPILLQDVIPCPNDKKVYLTMEINNLLSTLRKDHKTPSNLSREVLELRYSVGSRRYLNRPMSFVEVGRILKLSKETVRKVELKAIKHLRAI